MSGACELKSALLVAVTALACLPTPARADELADKGRKIFEQQHRAVVTVQTVVKTKMNFPGGAGRDSESKQDLTGTVIDPSGLTVVALSTVEPGSMLESMMGGAEIQGMKLKMETEVTDVKILLEDGTEVPAAIVLRDKDLDLAFIRPKSKPATPMPAVDLKKRGSAQVLEQVVTLNRLGAAASRSYAASVERITAVIQKPRKFYVPDSTMTATAQGSPAFTLDGNVLGIFVMRTIKGGGGGGMFGAGFNRGNLSSIILPAEDIQKAAAQAPQPKEEEKK